MRKDNKPAKTGDPLLRRIRDRITEVQKAEALGDGDESPEQNLPKRRRTAPIGHKQANELLRAIGQSGINFKKLDSNTEANILEALSQLSELLALSAAQQIRIDELGEQVLTDALTGAYNFRGFRESMGRALARRHETGETAEHWPDITVVFFDLNHFKAINDSIGYAAGNEALKHVSKIIKDKIPGSSLISRIGTNKRRKGDTSGDAPESAVSRFGGDEFVVVLYHTNEAQAKEYIESVKSALRETPFKCKAAKGEEQEITLSVASDLHVLKENDDVEKIIGDLSEKMRLRKREVRDTLVTRFSGQGHSGTGPSLGE